MLKKFLAVMAIIGVMSSSVAAADAGVKATQFDGGSISRFYSTSSFDPSEGERASITFTLTESSSVLLYVVDDNFNIVHQALNYSGLSADTYTYYWDGIYNGEPVEDGTYHVKLYTKSSRAARGVLEADEEIEVTSSVTPNPNPDPNPYPGNDYPQISNLDATPSSFDPRDDEDTEITFDVDEDAYVIVKIKDGLSTLRTFSDYSGNDWYEASASHSIDWDGDYNDGDFLEVGTYTVEVTAKNDEGTDIETITVSIDDKGPVSNGVIEDFELDPSGSWDPSDDDELEISFELTEEVDSLTIDAKKGNKIIEIIDEDDANDEDYEETWDGTDEDGDYVDEGKWEIIIRADGDKVSKTIDVKYEDPEITEAFVTKTSFDISGDEFTNLVFKVDAEAVVTVDVYDGSKKEFTILDEEEVSKNRYYVVKWDGEDDDGDEVDEGNDWSFRITAENPTDDDVFDTKTVDVDIDDDDVSSKKTNVTNDYTDPVVLDEDENDNMEFSFCIDDEAEITLEIYDGFSTGGSEEATLLDDVDHDKGCYTYSWDGTDDDGKDLDEDIYSYKITSKNGSHKDTEIGRFVIGNSEDSDNKKKSSKKNTQSGSEHVVDPTLYGECSNYYWDLGYMAESNELCEAITWVTERGVFQGYADGSFKPYQNITRAEAAKVILRAFDVDLFPVMDASTLGFTDVEPYAWYMTYIRTAKYYGMLTGDSHATTIRPGDYVNRVELLKIALQASQQFTGYEFTNGYYYPGTYADANPGEWFYDYANTAYQYELYEPYLIAGEEYIKPSNFVERGEVALLLYRMNKAGLL